MLLPRKKMRNLFDVAPPIPTNERVPVVAPLSFKGGVGKTTSSRIFAQSVANYVAPYRDDDRRVLLIDLDPQGNSSSHWLDMQTVHSGLFAKLVPPPHPFLEGSEDRPSSSICDVLLYGEEPVPYKTDVEHLDIVPNNEAEFLEVAKLKSDEDPAAEDPNSLESSLLYLRAWLDSDSIRDNYFLVVIDTPPRQDNVTQLALGVATHIYIPFQPSPQSYQGVMRIIHAISNEVMGRPHDNPLGFLGIFPTLVKNRDSLDNEIKELIKNDPNIGSYFMPFQMSQRTMFSDKHLAKKHKGDVFRSGPPSSPGFKEALSFVDALCSALGLTKAKYTNINGA